MNPPMQTDSFRRILGIDFFDGSAAEAVARLRDGGLLIVPSAPVLKDLDWSVSYRDAVLSADLVIADSAYMVMIWNRMQGDHLRRLSGLEYLAELLKEPSVRQPGGTLWIMASPANAKRNLAWLEREGIAVPGECVYMAPLYGPVIDDPELLERVRQVRPAHIVVTIGGGSQEPVGLYLKRNLDYLPGIHCIGAAIAFLSGDQVRIPMWADRLYLGWLFRLVSNPRRFLPRYWHARKLLTLMRRYGSELPPLRTA